MDIKLYYLDYCSKCKELMKLLDSAGIDYYKVDADSEFDESQRLEELLDTVAYPILEVYIDQETIYFVNDDVEVRKISEGVFVEVYSSFTELLYQIEKLIK